jgi:hypothetical protein
VTITDTTSVNSGGTANNSFTKSNISIPIFISDPCASTTLQRVKTYIGGNLGFASAGSLAVINGQTATRDFTKALDSVEVAQGLPTLCGNRIYRVCYNSACAATAGGQTDVTWISIAAKTGVANTFTLSASPNTITSTGPAITIGDNVFYLRTTLENYSGGPFSEEAVTVAVSAAACNCSKARWTAPTADVRTVNVNVPSNSYNFP